MANSDEPDPSTADHSTSAVAPPAVPSKPAALSNQRKPRSRLRRAIKWLVLLLLTLVVALVVFVMWASGGVTNDDAVAKSELIVLDPEADPPALTDTFGVMAFNIGYGRGPEGDYAGPWERAHIERHLDGIAAQIESSGVHIAALQEVDFDSARTHGIHEGRYLAEKLGFNWLSCTRTWEKNYVPFPYWPPSRHYGRMSSGQCLLSRFPIQSAVRYRQPQPEGNPFWKNLFYLNRAIDHIEVDVGGTTLHVFNVHLEAFSIENRMHQVNSLRGLLNGLSAKHAIALGDFNALPSGTAKTRGFEDEPEADFTGDQTMARADTMVDMREVLAGVDPLTFPAHAATRRLDYIYYRTTGIEPVSASVLDAQPPWSDHLPVMATLRLRP
ncbi:MAG: endonuclease/exonuclease/phosphatase family metal-dependent hydrolase [Myxococcota bacterium]